MVPLSSNQESPTRQRALRQGMNEDSCYGNCNGWQVLCGCFYLTHLPLKGSQGAAGGRRFVLICNKCSVNLKVIWALWGLKVRDLRYFWMFSDYLYPSFCFNDSLYSWQGLHKLVCWLVLSQHDVTVRTPRSKPEAAARLWGSSEYIWDLCSSVIRLFPSSTVKFCVCRCFLLEKWFGKCPSSSETPRDSFHLTGRLPCVVYLLC